MPGMGKSGNSRRAFCKLIFARESSEEPVVAEEDWDSSLEALSVSAAGATEDVDVASSAVMIEEEEEEGGGRGG